MRDFICSYSPLTVAAGLLALSNTAQAQTASGSFSLSGLSTTTTSLFSLNTTMGVYNIVFQANAGTTSSGCYFVASAESACSGFSVAWSVVAAKPKSLTLVFTDPAAPHHYLVGGQLATILIPQHVYLNYAIQAIGSSGPIIGASNAMTGDNNQGGPQTAASSAAVLASEYLCNGPAVTTCQGTGTDLATTTYSGPPGSNTSWSASSVGLVISPSQSTLNVSTHIYDGPGSNNSGYNIFSLTEKFNVPEPVSVSVLGIGAAAAAAARRWRRKPVQAAGRQPLKLAA